MARIDYRRVAREKGKKEAIAELKEFIKTDKGRKALPNWMGLHDYIFDQENTIVNQLEEIKKYREFFGTLSSLLPRQFSASDRIG